MTGRLQGRVALIIGGGSASGRATALTFAQEGAQVVIVDMSVEDGEGTERMVREMGRQAIFVEADASQPGETEALIRKAMDTYGRVDCALDGAGIGRQQGLTAEEIAEVLMHACSVAAQLATVPSVRSSCALSTDPRRGLCGEIRSH